MALPPLLPGQVLRLGPVAGTGTPTVDYGIGATDLCEFMEFPSGILQVCGDSFAGQGVGFGGWYSPIALHVVGDSLEDPAGVRYDGVTGVDTPLLADPDPAGRLAATRRRHRDQPAELHDGHHHRGPASADFPARESRSGPGQLGHGSGFGAGRRLCRRLQSQISGYYDPIPTAESPRGWVYIVANNFDRSGPVTLYRATPQTFTDRASWQGWAPDRLGWCVPRRCGRTGSGR